MAATLDSTEAAEVTQPLEEFLSDTDTTAFLVIQDDTLLYEKYFNGYDRESTQTSFSVTSQLRRKPRRSSMQTRAIRTTWMGRATI
jgi:hypothetical protein